MSLRSKSKSTRAKKASKPSRPSKPAGSWRSLDPEPPTASSNTTAAAEAAAASAAEAEAALATVSQYGALPPGRHLELSTGRTCFVRETGAVEGRPTLLLLHGWLASGGLNWMRAFESLNAHYRVLAPDFRGHARGGPSRTGFSMSESADDMGALLDALNLGGPAIVVGYSMGGMIAQELWRRHRSLVGGLVLSATSCAPVPISRGRTPFARIMNLANATTRKMGSALSIPTRILSTFERGLVEATDDAGTGREASPRAFTAPSMTPSTTPTSRSSDASAASIGTPPTSDWARREFARHHWPTVLDAGRAIAEFDTRDWIREVDVPTTVMLTKRDRLVPPHQQRAMAGRIPDARIETVDAGHFACVRDDFGPRILRSVRSVEKSMA